MAGPLHGRRTIICEVDGAEGLADLQDSVAGQSIDPEAALTEWIWSQPGGALAATILGHSRAFSHYVDAAPGVKELVTIGKIVDLARQPDPYDLVLADGPSTGHTLAMLNGPRTVAQVARHGPVGAQARPLQLLADNVRREHRNARALGQRTRKCRLAAARDPAHDGDAPDPHAPSQPVRQREKVGGRRAPTLRVRGLDLLGPASTTRSDGLGPAARRRTPRGHPPGSPPAFR
jgi:hypothetical protein